MYSTDPVWPTTVHNANVAAGPLGTVPAMPLAGTRTSETAGRQKKAELPSTGSTRLMSRRSDEGASHVDAKGAASRSSRG